MEFDPEANIISWELSKETISHVHEFGNFIIHLSPKGSIVLIEILDGSKLKNQFVKVGKLKKFGGAVATN